VEKRGGGSVLPKSVDAKSHQVFRIDCRPFRGTRERGTIKGKGRTRKREVHEFNISIREQGKAR